MISEDFKKRSSRISRVSDDFWIIEAITSDDVSIFGKFCFSISFASTRDHNASFHPLCKTFWKALFWAEIYLNLYEWINEKSKHISDSKVTFLTWSVGLFRPYVEVSEFIPAWYNDVKKILILIFSILFRRILW